MKTTFIKIECVQTPGVTMEANILNINYSNAMRIYAGSSISVREKIETQKFKKFLILKDKWKEETIFISSGTKIISNAAYTNIIDFGNIAIPWIIRELKRTNDHWFFALEKITGENPIKEENIGIVEKMKDDWINWATNKEYV